MNHSNKLSVLLVIVAVLLVAVVAGPHKNAVTKEDFKALWPDSLIIETPRSWGEQLQDQMTKHCYRDQDRNHVLDCPHEG